MTDEVKNRIQLINELNDLRQKISELEKLIQAQKDISYNNNNNNNNNLIFLESIFDIIPDVICIYDENYGVVRYNKAGYEFFKTSSTDAKGKKCFEVIGRTSPCDTCAVSDVYKTHKPSRVYRQINSRGLWLNIRAYPVLDKDQKLKYVINYIHDITFEKQTDELIELNKNLKIKINEHQTSEELIQKEKERMQKYFDVAGIIIVVISSDYKVKFVNKKGIETLGFENKVIVGKDWIENYIPTKYKKKVKKVLTRFSSGYSNPIENFEYPLLNSRGEERTIAWNYTPIQNDDGNYNILASGLDITERKKAEKALQISENKFRTLFDNASDAIFIQDMDDNFLEVNKIACQRLGYTKDELMKLKPHDIMYQSENNLSQLKIDIKHQGHVIFETFHIRKDDYLIPVEMNIRMIEYNGIPALLGIARDITERKQADEIKEKEIHHRVKNNLQVISSLLSLQSEFFENETVIEAFRESQNRVRSMALAHEELYQSRDIASIDVADYIQNLTNYLYLSYRGRSNEIELNIDIDNIFLNMDTAIPLGIIINELVSNSLKHAFANTETGKIKIKLRKYKNNSYTLTVSDNGTGFPENFDFRETDSLGMQLVNTLVEQIDGTIALDRYNGTVFTIKFRELVYKN